MSRLSDAATAAQDALEALHDQTVKDLKAGLAGDVAELHRKAMLKWIAAFGSVDAAADDPVKLSALVRELKADLQAMDTDVAPLITAALRKVHKLAASHALDAFPDLDAPAGTVTIPKHTVDQVQVKADGKLRDAAIAFDVLQVGDGFDDLQAGLTRTNEAVTAVTRGGSYLLTQAATDAVNQVAAANGIGWVIAGERNACLKCNPFIGLTDLDTQDQPPYHPHCVCVVQPYDHATTNSSNVSYPEALRREAERSVALGSSDWDTDAARVRAAKTLQAERSQLPKTVQARSVKAIRAGSFTRK